MKAERLGRGYAKSEGARRVTRFDELYREYADDAVRLAYLLTGQRETAEDLVQDAFIRVARRLAHLRNPDAFWGYLRQTIVNLANSHFRRRRIERAFLSQEHGFAEAHTEERGPEGG